MNDNLERTLATYRAQLEVYPDFALEILVHYYGILCSDNRQAYIDALVQHFKYELELNR